MYNLSWGLNLGVNRPKATNAKNALNDYLRFPYTNTHTHTHTHMRKDESKRSKGNYLVLNYTR